MARRTGAGVIVAACGIGIVAIAAFIVVSHRNGTRSRVAQTGTVSPDEARVQAHLQSLTNEMRHEMQAPPTNAPAAKVEDEYDANGLVLLTTTLKGTRAEDGSAIVGTVVNRRNQPLSRVQISFNLYDKAGARVGTAVAKAGHLEAGGQWNFKAPAAGAWSTFKVVELTGS
jgi:Tfp pilus assembly protein PilV